MRLYKEMALFLVGAAAGVLLLLAIMRVIYHGRIFPGVQIGSLDVSEMSQEQAARALANRLSGYEIRFKYGETSWQVPKEVLQVNIEETAARAYHMGRRWNLGDYWLAILRHPNTVQIDGTVDEDELNAWLDETITQTVEQPPTAASIKLVKGKVQFTNGSTGTIIDREKMLLESRDRLSKLSETGVEVALRNIDNILNEEEAARLTENANKLATASATLTLDDTRLSLPGESMLTFLSTNPREDEPLDQGVIEAYVQTVAQTLNRGPENAKFNFEGEKVTEFAPGKDGVRVKEKETTEAIFAALDKILGGEGKQTIAVAVTRTAPDVTTDKVNNLGIKERIGHGESYYAHSIANRVKNVSLTAARLNAALVPPGEEFSFNGTIGEVSAATGYFPAYVISQGRTVLGDGGGVCQVSTTLFRAVLNAGLPITERWAHAYRVGYYEQNSKPGFDATVYSPSKDFKFRNDTPGYILVQTINDPKNLHLTIDIYGTNDGRVATVSAARVWDNVSPPPDLYQDDPTSPVGTVKQVDWSAWGAKAAFDYKVTRGGETIFAKTYTSNYQPWQNVYLRGTATP